MTEKNTVPSLEARASEGYAIFTPRQWLKRFRQFIKREHKIDIAPLIKGEDITEWTGKEQLIQEDFFRGVGPEALYQITRAEYKTKPDSIKIRPDPAIYRILLTETKHVPQPRRFFGQSKRRKKHPKNSGED